MAEVLVDVQENIEDTQKGRFLTFILDKEVYGIEIKYDGIKIKPATEDSME